MDEQRKLTRRAFFRGAATVAGAALAGTVIPIRIANAQQKASKKSMQYQDKPKGDQECDKCMQFVAPDSCKVVDGKISPKGWCIAFTKKQ